MGSVRLNTPLLLGLHYLLCPYDPNVLSYSWRVVCDSGSTFTYLFLIYPPVFHSFFFVCFSFIFLCFSFSLSKFSSLSLFPLIFSLLSFFLFYVFLFFILSFLLYYFLFSFLFPSFFFPSFSVFLYFSYLFLFFLFPFLLFSLSFLLFKFTHFHFPLYSSFFLSFSFFFCPIYYFLSFSFIHHYSLPFSKSFLSFFLLIISSFSPSFFPQLIFFFSQIRNKTRKPIFFAPSSCLYQVFVLNFVHDSPDNKIKLWSSVTPVHTPSPSWNRPPQPTQKTNKY